MKPKALMAIDYQNGGNKDYVPVAVKERTKSNGVVFNSHSLLLGKSGRNTLD